ncbi:hypothetical protein [Bacillus sp. MUM 13]|uniref:hypothetical protein n=1 Tax=Bacillus sp. MUM 13 TaxID=1678001 RepID=UPI0008F5A342|nr:hypothetical protein [Bacillus sp. MUM 13]OIK13532.1 hypothetical protein BIV59_05540 [Bacillus sp. MUM 13]
MVKRTAEAWAEAKKRCRLNEADIQMAKELGMTAKSLLKNIPAPDQKWKASVKIWIRDLYEEKFNKVLTGKHPFSEESHSISNKREKEIVPDYWENDEDLPF